jgi:catechol 2,3-dioxygenase-like lactoylglutathione lyase family enzyme
MSLPLQKPAPAAVADIYWNPLVPELAVTDLAASLRFYRAAGFTVRFRRSEPEFAYLELGQAQLMLEEDTPGDAANPPLERPRGRGTSFQVEVDDARSIVASLRESGFPLHREPVESWYAVTDNRDEGQLELQARDPDGYLFRFVEVLGMRNS